MDPCAIPPELQNLTFVEEQLIARIHPVVSVYKLKGNQLGYSGNVINFPQEVTELATRLPHRVADLESLIAVRSHGAGGHVDFKVRAGRVRAALLYLKRHHRYYRDIEISEENLAALPVDGCVFSQVPGFEDPTPAAVPEVDDPCAQDPQHRAADPGGPGVDDRCAAPHQHHAAALGGPGVADPSDAPHQLRAAAPGGPGVADRCAAPHQHHAAVPGGPGVADPSDAPHQLRAAAPGGPGVDDRCAAPHQHRAAAPGGPGVVEPSGLHPADAVVGSNAPPNQHHHAAPVVDPLDAEVIDGIQITGLPMLQPHQHGRQVQAAVGEPLEVINWPTIGANAVNEFTTEGYISMCFPCLFPHGAADLRQGRPLKKLNPAEYFQFLIEYGDGRFARHKTFRFFALNSLMRWTSLTNGRVFVRNNPTFRNMTAQDLRQQLRQDRENTLKGALFYGSKVKGTRPFWQARTGELLDMVDQLKTPTLFMTLSAADLHWPDLFRILAPDEDQATMSEARRHQLLNDNPYIANSFFHERAKLFIEETFKNKEDVVDFWYRFEYQHRGSPHSHLLIWCRGAPDISNLATMSEAERQAVIDYFDRLVKAVNPNRDAPPAEQQPCRKRLSEVQDRARDLAELLNRVQRHRCSRVYCQRKDKNGNTYCRFKFPFALEEMTRLFVNDQGQFELLLARNDEWLNKYIEWAIQLWRANMDASPILSEKFMLRYCAKYTAKGEGRSETCAELAQGVLERCGDNDTALSVIQKLLMKTVSERDYSAQEACHILSGRKLHECSRKFVVVDLRKKAWVELHQQPDGHNQPAHPGQDEEQEDVDDDLDREVNADGLGAEQDAAVGLGDPDVQEGDETFAAFVQSYMRRPREMEHMSLRDVALRHGPPKGRDNRWSNNRREAIVRVFPRVKLTANEEKNEQFYRVQVLLHVPWRSEEEVKGASPTWKAVFEDNNLGAVAAEGDAHGAGRNIHEAVAEINSVLHPEMNAPVVKRVIVQGKAGCGKSTVIQKMMTMISDAFGPEAVKLMAFTGVAALNIGGETINSALKIPVKVKQYPEMPAEALRKFQDSMSNVKFLIIDEYSMVGSRLLGYMERRCRDGKPDSNDIFAGCFTWLIGDIKQLPPVGDATLYPKVNVNNGRRRRQQDCLSAEVIRGRMVFASFTTSVVLSVSQRQADNSLRDALDRVSIGTSTDADYQLFRARFKLNVAGEERETFRDAVHLYWTRAAVVEHNKRKLVDLQRPVARIPAKHHGPGAADGSADDAGGLEKVIYLAKGSRVMLRSNLWLRAGLVNGALGTVVDVIYHHDKAPPEDPPAVIMVKFDDYSGPTMPDGTVPIISMMRGWEDKNGRRLTREQFPLSLAWASTVHKAQGLTMDRVVVSVDSHDFSLGMLYVALSRCKSWRGLLLDREFDKDRLNAIRSSDGFHARMRAEAKIQSMSRM
ncbi:hypothetical protein FOCC_FOCC015271 [Frankliniella occidentalis]|nr:hypothetical protein FOCC_FOCC015271 [Frankliniella occidentalis]